MDGSSRYSDVKILFFAKARELAGLTESRILLPEIVSYGSLLEGIVEKFGLQSIRDTLILSLNEEYIAYSNSVIDLSDKDEIAVIPPLSGGSYIPVKMGESKDVVKLQTDRLNIGEIVETVIAHNCGAVSTFIGTTRDNFESKKVIKLEYEAYEPMALKELRNVCSKIRKKWDVETIAIYHRLGVVPVSEASIVIAISSPHRRESLEATQFAIETVKSTVPIWKKEIYDGEESQWKENTECECEIPERKANLEKIEASISLESQKISIPGVNELVNQNQSKDKNTKSPDAEVDQNLVQIRASTEELNRRIEAFIARKREQVNIVNVQEFCCHRARIDEEESSCARVDAILIRRKDSKSHVKVHRVLNPWGPQMMDPSTLHKGSRNNSNESSPSNYPPVLEERFATSESQIGIKGPVPKDVYQRLKRVEDRILYLESISPEYRNFWGGQEDESLKSSYKPVRKRTYSTAELDTKLYELERKYVKKSN